MRPSHFLLPAILVAAILVAALSSCAEHSETTPETAFGQPQFEALLSTLAQGWNSNDATLAASVFSEDAIYAEPPDKQLYVGRDAIFKFFGGPEGRPSWMKIVWHNVSYNNEQQLGAGEFTFSWEGGQVHGITSIKIEDGLISRWREYFYESELSWADFQRTSQF